MSRTRAETKQATRKTLIRAGIAEFSRHGFDVSLDQICARAKLTRGAFYVHFADRDAFIVAVMQDILGTFVAALTGLAPAAPNLERAIDVFFIAVAARAPIVTGASGLRFYHVLEACRRSKAIGDTYRGILMTGRDRVRELDPARADLLAVVALGLLVVTELDLPIDLERVRAALSPQVRDRG
jgi:TetR/AcrR family transcriptional regulator, transcriptional repressor for nem operon